MEKDVRTRCRCEVSAQSPTRVLLLRGAHETAVCNERFGFWHETLAKFGGAGSFGASPSLHSTGFEKASFLWRLANGVFDCLSLAAISKTRDAVFMSGGPAALLTGVHELKNIPKPVSIERMRGACVPASRRWLCAF